MRARLAFLLVMIATVGVLLGSTLAPMKRYPTENHLTVSISASPLTAGRGELVAVNVKVSEGGRPVTGAFVLVSMIYATGVVASINGTTDAAGSFVWNARINPEAPLGSVDITVIATLDQKIGTAKLKLVVIS